MGRCAARLVDTLEHNAEPDRAVSTTALTCLLGRPVAAATRAHTELTRYRKAASHDMNGSSRRMFNSLYWMCF